MVIGGSIDRLRHAVGVAAAFAAGVAATYPLLNPFQGVNRAMSWSFPICRVAGKMKEARTLASA